MRPLHIWILMGVTLATGVCTANLARGEEAYRKRFLAPIDYKGPYRTDYFYPCRIITVVGLLEPPRPEILCQDYMNPPRPSLPLQNPFCFLVKTACPICPYEPWLANADLPLSPQVAVAHERIVGRPFEPIYSRYFTARCMEQFFRESNLPLGSFVARTLGDSAAALADSLQRDPDPATSLRARVGEICFAGKDKMPALEIDETACAANPLLCAAMYLEYGLRDYRKGRYLKAERWFSRSAAILETKRNKKQRMNGPGLLYSFVGLPNNMYLYAIYMQAWSRFKQGKDPVKVDQWAHGIVNRPHRYYYDCSLEESFHYDMERMACCTKGGRKCFPTHIVVPGLSTLP